MAQCPDRGDPRRRRARRGRRAPPPGRLRPGRRDAPATRSSSPRRFAAAGAARVHLVDLDGARAGRARPELVRTVAEAIAPARLQASGRHPLARGRRGPARGRRRPDRARHRRVPRSRARGREALGEPARRRARREGRHGADGRLDGRLAGLTPRAGGRALPRGRRRARPLHRDRPRRHARRARPRARRRGRRVRARRARGGRRSLARRRRRARRTRAPRPRSSAARSSRPGSRRFGVRKPRARTLTRSRKVDYLVSGPRTAGRATTRGEHAQARDHAGSFDDTRSWRPSPAALPPNGPVRRQDLAAPDQRLRRSRHLHRGSGKSLKKFTFGTLGCFGHGSYPVGTDPYGDPTEHGASSRPIPVTRTAPSRSRRSPTLADPQGIVTTATVIQGTFTSSKSVSGTITITQTQNGDTCGPAKMKFTADAGHADEPRPQRRLTELGTADTLASPRRCEIPNRVRSGRKQP